MTVIVSIEGGGGRRAEQASLRKAFSELFGKLGIGRPLPSAECNGSRNAAEKSFQLHRRRLAAKAILLVDSEGVVPTGKPAWEHLNERDGWRLEASLQDQVFLGTAVSRSLTAKFFKQSKLEAFLAEITGT